MSKSHPFPNLVKTLQAGIITGFIGATIGNILGIITQNIAQVYYPETSIAAITLSSISIGIVGSILYYFIYMQTRQFARDIFTMIGLTLPTIITLYVLSSQYDTPFRIIAVSIAYAVSMISVILIPILAEKYNFGEAHAGINKKA